MKLIMLSTALLFTVLANAAGDNGYIQKVVEDDEGAKVVLSKATTADGKPAEIKTIYMKNTQPNFEETKQMLLNSQTMKTRVNLSKDAMKTLSVKQLGQ